MTNEQSFDWKPLSETFKTAADAAAEVTPERSRGVRKVIVSEFISLDEPAE